MRATITSSDFEFNLKEVDFGHCSVYEKVVKTIQLTNKSVLPQQYGFIGTPEVRSVCAFFGLDRCRKVLDSAFISHLFAVSF